jgi:hypothetical protein
MNSAGGPSHGGVGANYVTSRWRRSSGQLCPAKDQALCDQIKN